MNSTSFALLGAITLAACSSGTSGNSGTFEAPPTATVSDSVTTSDPPGTSGGDDDTMSFGESSTTDEPTTTASPTTAATSTGEFPDTPALLVWTLDQPTLDYADIPVDNAASSIIVLENVGGHTATSMATDTIPGDFSFPGGYPGTEGTCGTELDAGQTCRLDLRFGPTRVGPVQSSLLIEYYDGVNLGSPTQTEVLTLLGGGQGESANLLLNGDAETGDTEHWNVPAGFASWTTTGSAFGGSFAFTPTGAIVVTSLDQGADLSNWQDETSVPGLRYRVRARARSNTGEHNYRVYIDLGNDFLPLIDGTATSWTLVEHIDDVPDGAAGATVRIECANNDFGAGPCDVSFDDIALQLVYP
ncbi:MAG: hypothetical protein KUG77_06835 [Nannocystaceae bacterium]|nr:hypothetical protein [Nannocystaceae bacterium]